MKNHQMRCNGWKLPKSNFSTSDAEKGNLADLCWQIIFSVNFSRFYFQKKVEEFFLEFFFYNSKGEASVLLTHEMRYWRNQSCRKVNLPGCWIIPWWHNSIQLLLCFGSLRRFNFPWFVLVFSVVISANHLDELLYF